jgi:hypothetical protein
VPEADQGVELLVALQLGHEHAELLGRTFVVIELDQCKTLLQADASPQVVSVGELQRPRIEVEDRTLGPAAPCLVGPDQEVMNGAGRLVALTPVVGQDRRERVRRGAEHLLDRLRDGGVTVTPGRARHGGIGDLANQHVPERELHVTAELARGIALDDVPRLENQ